MKTAVVILNWNTKNYLEQFVPGVLRSLEGEDACLVVADSASTDGSMQMLAEKFPEVRQIRLDKNYGFTGGYNRALRQIDAEYYVLLNSDIEVPEGWLKPLVQTMDSCPDVGACSPKLHSWFEKDKFEYAGAAGGYLDYFGFPFCRGRLMKMLEKDEGQYDRCADVLWATGACLMVRSSLFNGLGGLDDRFFAHMEEIDLCWRIQLAGYRIRIVPESLVYHIGGGTLPQTSPWKLKLNYRNNLMLLENNLTKTLALTISEKEKGIDNSGKIAAKAVRQAGRRIWLRMVIDGLTGAAYLLMLKRDCFKAVIDAHKEFRQLSKRPGAEEVNDWLSESAAKRPRPQVQGIYPHLIIPMAIFLRNKSFGIINKYFQK